MNAGGLHPSLVIALTLNPLDDALEFLSANLGDRSWLWEHLGSKEPSECALKLVQKIMGWVESRAHHPAVLLRIVCALGGLGSVALNERQAEHCAGLLMESVGFGTRVIELGLVWLIMFPRYLLNLE